MKAFKCISIVVILGHRWAIKEFLKPYVYGTQWHYNLKAKNLIVSILFTFVEDWDESCHSYLNV